MSDLSKAIFHDETKAREWLEAELWPNGPVCPHCGVVNEATLMQGKSHSPGLYNCNACREPFTVTVGALYERSKIPLHKWLAATHLLMASKKGMSALQVGRMLGLSKKTAWFLCHRIRESLRQTSPEMLGGDGKTVEADESFVGGLEKNKHRSKRKHQRTGGTGKEAVVALFQRGGRVRSDHIPEVPSKTLGPIEAQLHGASYVYTDEGSAITKAAKQFDLHDSVKHSTGEYVRGNVHTNMKRGINGDHHVSQQHLKRYLAEFDLRYNERSALRVEDAERMAKSIKGIVGKRLTYQTSHC
jgi:transposase-like protein